MVENLISSPRDSILICLPLSALRPQDLGPQVIIIRCERGSSYWILDAPRAILNFANYATPSRMRQGEIMFYLRGADCAALFSGPSEDRAAYDYIDGAVSRALGSKLGEYTKQTNGARGVLGSSLYFRFRRLFHIRR